MLQDSKVLVLSAIKENKEHDPKRPYVGQILYSKCGYNCQLVTFYQVVKVTKCFVWVKELKAKITENVDGYGQQVMKRPIKNDFYYKNNKSLRRKIYKDTFNGAYAISISTYENAYPWKDNDLFEDSLD